MLPADQGFKADCIQWIMETSPRQKPWTPKRIVYELMAIWFGSVHALSTVRFEIMVDDHLLTFVVDNHVCSPRLVSSPRIRGTIAEGIGDAVHRI